MKEILWSSLTFPQAETISLGILSLPATLAVVGIIPGVILILGLGMLATYTGYVYGQFRNQYPGVTGIGDAFQILFNPFGPRWGKFGRVLGDIGQLLFMLFLMASHILTFVIAFETVVGRICSIWWGVIATVLFLLLGLPRTLKSMSYMSIFSAASVTVSVAITMIALGVSKPSTGLTGTNPYNLWPVEPPPFYKVFISVTNIVFAYAGHAAFFTFITELKDPREFPKSLALLQTVDISLYALSACVIYIFAGAGVKSPALSSTSHHVQMASWIVALPTVCSTQYYVTPSNLTSQGCNCWRHLRACYLKGLIPPYLQGYQAHDPKDNQRQCRLGWYHCNHLGNCIHSL